MIPLLVTARALSCPHRPSPLLTPVVALSVTLAITQLSRVLQVPVVNLALRRPSPLLRVARNRRRWCTWVTPARLLTRRWSCIQASVPRLLSATALFRIRDGLTLEKLEATARAMLFIRLAMTFMVLTPSVRQLPTGRLLSSTEMVSLAPL